MWTQCRNLRIPLQCRHGSWGSSGVSPGESVLVSSGACTCDFLPRCSSSVMLPFRGIKGSGAVPRGFPTRLSYRAVPRPPWCESIRDLKVEAVQGKQVSLEWSETTGGLWEWWHDPGVPLAFPEESASSRCDGNAGILSRPLRERIPPLELGVGNGAPLNVGGTLLLPLEWRRVCRGTS